MIKYQYIFFILVFFSSAYGFDYPKRFQGYYSQHGQDKYLVEEVFNYKENGFFLEIGAHDGISFSNTYCLEKDFHWRGICVEPIPELFEKLKNNRQCICENVCIDVVRGKKNFLRCFGFITEMYSGIADYYDSRHLLRIDKEIEEYGGEKMNVEVDCIE